MSTTTATGPAHEPKRIVIVGGVAGGMSAAARARRLDEHVEIIVLEQGAYVSFANCGLPYHLSGEIAERDELLLHTPDSLAESLNLDVRIGHRVTGIDRHAQKVTIQAGADTYALPYEALLLSPGAVAVRPPIEGLDHPAVHTLRTVPDVDALRERIEDLLAARGPRQPSPSAVVIGAGFIGLEAVEALSARGLQVHLVELADHVLPPLDAELAPLLADELAAHGVDLHLGVSAQAVRPGAAMPVTLGDSIHGSREGGSGSVTVTLSDGACLAADLVIVNVGVRPASALALDAGLELGPTGAIRVDGDQHTSDPHIWAVGDAVEVTQAITGARIPVPLAAPRTGRVAGRPTRSAGAGQLPRRRSLAPLSSGSSTSQPPQPARTRRLCVGRGSPMRWCTSTRATTRATSRDPSRSTSSRASPPMAGSWEPRASAAPAWTSASTSSPQPSVRECRPKTSPSWSSPTRRRTAPPRTR